MYRNSLIGALAISLHAFCVSAQDSSPTAEECWAKFTDNLSSIVTCEVYVHTYGSRFDTQFVTNQHQYRRSGELIRWDQLTRGQRRQGVISENLAQLFFDGSETLQITINLAGLPRDYSPVEPRGIRAQVTPGLEQRLNDALVLEVLRLNAYAVGESLSFAQVPSAAETTEVIDHATPTVRYTLSDLQQGESLYTNRFVEFEFGEEHGWWITHAKFGSTPSSGSPMNGGIRVAEFHELESGRYFPKTIRAYSIAPDGTEKPGPVTEVKSCKVNEPVAEAAIPLATPIALPISVETRREGDLHLKQLKVVSAQGETREFQDHDAFAAFAKTVKGEESWTGSYAPPDDFDYYFKDEKQAKALLQQALGTANLSQLRSGDSTRTSKDQTPDEADSSQHSTGYLLWGGIAVLAAVSFLAVQQISRSRASR